MRLTLWLDENHVLTASGHCHGVGASDVLIPSGAAIGFLLCTSAYMTVPSSEFRTVAKGDRRWRGERQTRQPECVELVADANEVANDHPESLGDVQPLSVRAVL
ncbi:hypothetical protein BaRGS_00016999 [Batillaria attramentaria]|uniref:Uncharacterized protein n=1 Tax=Batillaria attramentaria TaxID=370345 RepID=A0ABD0KX52_9CAEN